MSTPFPPDCAAQFTSVRPLAVGGYGTVYLAIQTALQRQVAVKVLHASGELEPEQRERFLSEARMTASLDHPNVVRIIDHGAASGVPWIAYELLSGETLAARLERQGPFSEDDALAAAIQVSAALEAAHQRDIVHRDVKPENVMYGVDGHCTLMDFGIGKWSEGVRTAAGMILGTPGFIAPEQIRGETAGPAGDVYALGVTLYVLITGRTPFEGADARAVIEAQVREDAPSPSTFARVSPAVEALLTRLLARDPRVRPADARELRAALESARARSGVQAARTPAAPAPIRGRTRALSGRTRVHPVGTMTPRRSPAASLAGVALVGIGLCAYVWTARAPTPGASPAATVRASRPAADAEVFERRGVQLLAAGRKVEAVACFREALEAHPDSTPLRFGLGCALHATAAYEEAEGLLREIVAQPFPRIAYAHHMLSRVLFARGKHDEAARAESKAQAADRDDVDLHAQIAGELYAAGRRGPARIHLEGLKDGKMENKSLEKSVAFMLLDQGLDEMALTRARNVYRAASDRDSAILLATVVLKRQGDIEGVAALETELAKSPRDREVIALLARFHAGAGRACGRSSGSTGPRSSWSTNRAKARLICAAAKRCADRASYTRGAIRTCTCDADRVGSRSPRSIAMHHRRAASLSTSSRADRRPRWRSWTARPSR